jgi:hypothetical protein
MRNAYQVNESVGSARGSDVTCFIERITGHYTAAWGQTLG